MKTILLIFAICLLSLTAFSQNKQTDLQFKGLKGKVKSVQSSSLYLGTKDEPKKSPKRDYYSIEIYNLEGNLVEELNPERGTKYVYEFVDGFLSMREVVVDKRKSDGARGGLIGNAENMEKPLKSIKPDERFISRYEYEYDDNGRRKLRRIFFSDGKMDSITRYSYNSAGLLENEIYNSYGNKWSYYYSYDNDGNRKEKIMKRSNVNNVVDMKDLQEYRDYKFDTEGNWVERKYTFNHEYGGSSTTSESIEYREIKYHGADEPKRNQAAERKNKCW
jgi:hypothetical protein